MAVKYTCIHLESTAHTFVLLRNDTENNYTTVTFVVPYMAAGKPEQKPYQVLGDVKNYFIWIACFQIFNVKLIFFV